MNELSVIVPVYNGQDFLPTALATIRQNHRDGIEFIVIDDHSTDETPRIIAAALPSMPYLTYLRNAANVGVARSRNIALQHVNARYLGYYDVDDWWAPGYLPQMLDAAKDLKVDQVRFDHIRTAGRNRTYVNVPELRRGVPVPARDGIGAPGGLATVDYPYLWAGIYDLARIDRSLFAFHEHLRTAADRPWFWRMHLETRDFAVADIPAGYFYRKDRNPRALTQGGNPATLHFADAYHLILDLAAGSGDPAHIEKAAYGMLRITIFHIRARARLSDELQSRLFAVSAVLLARLSPKQFERAVHHFDLSARRTLTKLYRHGTLEHERLGLSA